MRITNFLTKVILQWTGNSKVLNVHGFSSRFVCHKKKVLEFEFDFTFVRFLSRTECFQTATKKRCKISWVVYKRLTMHMLKKGRNSWLTCSQTLVEFLYQQLLRWLHSSCCKCTTKRRNSSNTTKFGNPPRRIPL